MTSCGETVPSTPMELVSKLTEQDSTPGSLLTAFSTLALQAAQLIPVTVYCSILLPPRILLYPFYKTPFKPLFHQLLQRCQQLLYRLFFSVFDVLNNTAFDMICQQHPVKTV